MCSVFIYCRNHSGLKLSIWCTSTRVIFQLWYDRNYQKEFYYHFSLFQVDVFFTYFLIKQNTSNYRYASMAWTGAHILSNHFFFISVHCGIEFKTENISMLNLISNHVHFEPHWELRNESVRKNINIKNVLRHTTWGERKRDRMTHTWFTIQKQGFRFFYCGVPHVFTPGLGSGSPLRSKPVLGKMARHFPEKPQECKKAVSWRKKYLFKQVIENI